MGTIDRTGAQAMLYLTCTMISSVDLAHYRVFRAKDWVSVDCSTIEFMNLYNLRIIEQLEKVYRHLRLLWYFAFMHKFAV